MRPIIKTEENKEYLKNLILNREIKDVLDPLITLRYGLKDWYPTLYEYVYNKLSNYVRLHANIDILDREYQCNSTYMKVASVSKNINIDYGTFLNIVLIDIPKEIVFVSTNAIRY